MVGAKGICTFTAHASDLQSGGLTHAQNSHHKFNHLSLYNPGSVLIVICLSPYLIWVAGSPDIAVSYALSLGHSRVLIAVSTTTLYSIFITVYELSTACSSLFHICLYLLDISVGRFYLKSCPEFPLHWQPQIGLMIYFLV